VIRLRAIVHSFAGARVLSGVNLDVARGELVAITGERGCGKTTVLQILATLLSPDSGALEIEGVDMRKRGGTARKKIALADGWLAPGDELTTAEYLELATGIRRGMGADAVTHARLNPTRSVATLNAEERVRLSIACALASHRDVVLIDAAIDACFTPRLTEVLAAGAAVVTTTASPLSTRTFRLHDGRLETILSTPRRETACIA
jgi:ABC-2 type transport system ATP-binding protein